VKGTKERPEAAIKNEKRGYRPKGTEKNARE